MRAFPAILPLYIAQHIVSLISQGAPDTEGIHGTWLAPWAAERCRGWLAASGLDGKLAVEEHVCGGAAGGVLVHLEDRAVVAEVPGVPTLHIRHIVPALHHTCPVSDLAPLPNPVQTAGTTPDIHEAMRPQYMEELVSNCCRIRVLYMATLHA